jgi:bile salt-stimulated lipase
LVYGPDLLLREDVVVVTINYRLSSLGFLSTEDKHAQGNYALKDMVMALKWVKENIGEFGGNAERITVFGQSAGSTSVHLLLISDMAKGLFHQAIMQSGTGVSPFAFRTNPRTLAEDIGRNLNLTFESTEELMNKLRQVDYKSILKVERGLFNMEAPLGLRPFDFVPTLEPEDSLEERFLTEDPTISMINGTFYDVPVIIGTTSKEGLLMVREYMLDEDVFSRYNENDNFFVPLSFELAENTPEVEEVADIFKKMYFDGKLLSEDNLAGWAKFHTDAQFKFPTERVIKSLAKFSTQPIYYYDFTYDGGLNFLKTLLFLRSYDGACHADDIFYLFSPAFPIPVWPTDHALTVRRRLIRLWANFAKTG